VAILLLVLATVAPAQAPRLVDCVEAPIAYVRIDGGENGANRRATVQRLLDGAVGTAVVGEPAGPMARACQLVRMLLARDCGEVELVLTGVVPGVGRPLLLLRVRLPEAEAGRLHGLLHEGSLAAPHRTLGTQQTWRLLADAAAGDAVADRGPGARIELALVGADLVVGNDDLGMQELLAPMPASTTAAPRRVLSADPRFQELRQRLDAPPGSLFAYGDWQRLGHRLQGLLTGLPGALLDRSGAAGARRVMLSLAPAPGATACAATLLLSFEDAAGSDPGAVAAIDGWLAAAQSVPPRQLLPELPVAELGGMVVAVDLADLAARSPRGARLLHDLRHSLAAYGLDFERHVLGRLGTLGTVQLLLRDGEVGAAAEVVAAYAVRARSRAAAGDLFTDLRRAAEAHGIGRLVVARDRRTPDVLELRAGADAARPPICVTVVDDTVLVAHEAATLQRSHDDHRRSAKVRGRRDAVVAGAVQRMGGAAVCGLFDLDLRGLFVRLLRSKDSGGASPDLAAVPMRYVGTLASEAGTGGVFVRVCVWSLP
jgi:hypothetical protein